MARILRFDLTEFGSPLQYHAAKDALIQATRYLVIRLALGNIRINSFSPGTFPKTWLTNAPDELEQRMDALLPLGRVGNPDEIAGVVIFISSDASSCVTGQNLVVDGGWTAW